MGIFLFTLVGVRTNPTRKSSVSSEVGCVCCDTEVHPGESLQILKGIDPAPFRISDDTALDFNRGRIKMGAFPNSPGQFYKLRVVFTQFYVWLKNNEASHPYPSWALCMSLIWGSSVNTYICGSLHTCKQSHQASLEVEKGEYETYPLSKFHARPQIQVLVESCLLLIFWKTTEFSSLNRIARSLGLIG